MRQLGCPAGLTPRPPPPPPGSLPQLARPASAALPLPLLTGVSGFWSIWGGPTRAGWLRTPRSHPLNHPLDCKEWKPVSVQAAGGSLVKTHSPPHCQALCEPSRVPEDQVTQPFSGDSGVGHLSLSPAPFGHPGGEETHDHGPPRPRAPHLHSHHPVTPSPLSTSSQGDQQ